MRKPRSVLTALATGFLLAAPLPVAAGGGSSGHFTFREGSALVLRGVVHENSSLPAGVFPDPQRVPLFRDRGIGTIVAVGFRPGRPVPVPSAARVPLPGSLSLYDRQSRSSPDLADFPEDVDPFADDLGAEEGES